TYDKHPMQYVRKKEKFSPYLIQNDY
ncbi:metallo-beta-lactamase superfamily protein, partial [Staphylococcus hominis]